MVAGLDEPHAPDHAAMNVLVESVLPLVLAPIVLTLYVVATVDSMKEKTTTSAITRGFAMVVEMVELKRWMGGYL